MVVTEMNTPTMVDAFSIAIANAPAAPAMNATMKDHWSGCQMKPVAGRGAVTMSSVISPVSRPSRANTVTTRTANANPPTSNRRPRPTSAHLPNATPTATAPTALNSGPTTMAPTTRMAESRITAIPARVTAITRKSR
jgi:hypothetical protein